MIHVLLDTEIFRHERLRFGSKRFSQLGSFVQAGHIQVYVTDVVTSEVRKAIPEEVAAAIALVPRKTRKALGLLFQTNKAAIAGLSELADGLVLTNELQAMFDRLLADLHVITISTDQIPVAELRRRYFSSVAPFSATALKKHEFPDALTMLGAELYANAQDLELHVVSGDKGIGEACGHCSRLIAVSSLAAMLSRVNEVVAGTITKSAEHAFTVLGEQIRSRVKELFEDNGMDVRDELEGEVIEVLVSDVDLGEPAIEEVDAETSRAHVTFEAEVMFTAEVTAADPDQTTYDSEAGEFIIFDYRSATVSESIRVEGSVDLRVSVDDPSVSEITDLTLFADNLTIDSPWNSP